MRITKHPLGFTKIVLFSLFGFELRLHYWPRGSLDSRADIHNHRWSFISLPLVGNFKEKVFRVVENEPENALFTKLLCYPERQNGTRDIIKSGHGLVEKISEQKRRAFRPYYFPALAIHSYEPLEPQRALSIVLTFPPRAEYAEVWQ